MELSFSLSPACRGHSEKAAVYKLGRGFSPELYHAGNPGLKSPGSRTMRNKVCCLSYPVYGIYYGSLSWLR